MLLEASLAVDVRKTAFVEIAMQLAADKPICLAVYPIQRFAAGDEAVSH